MTFTQRLKRVFNIGITEYEKCQKHNVTIIACIIDPHVIQKVLTYFDKKQPSSAQAKSILAPMREPPQQDFDLGLSTQTLCHYEHAFR
ncbi:MAG: Asp-tRNA(Asn)/Glu-tRNA(Gln) amidotransferase B subunit [Gammaproteobacteria bacterium]|jgi:Asp-tRNA(Asn)/Glu-tRNA(Gln) amidotransferase B subunit